ncbi:MAG TPA: tyrosine-type recombinase/integrase [Candidatus Saccharimonadales bacterium]|jgi:integrase/recombinase XerD|nr:tyrosine-type recombinase/integrase [Candidatus Saccharimonadales bacterium]
MDSGHFGAQALFQIERPYAQLEDGRKKSREMERLDLEATKPQPVAIKTAVQAFVADQLARKLLQQSINKSWLLLEGEFGPWCEKRSLETLQQLGPAEIREFRCVWDNGPKSAHRKHERMRSFFVFCISNGWLQNNPMNVLKKPRAPDVVPTNYFTRTDFEKIVKATHHYDYGGGNDCHHRAERLRALVLLMRWSGLAIKDAVMLERNRLSDNGFIFLRRAKTGVPVLVPLPPILASQLRCLPSNDQRYFFWSGNGDPRSAVKGYQRSFWKLFRLADIKNPDGTRKRCHSHMFRDTFAVELLLAGISIDQVSILLGHRSVKMTEKHYLPWVKARQELLTASVQRAWFPEVTLSPE